MRSLEKEALKLYWVKVIMYKTNPSTPSIRLFWDGFTFERFNRWRWYFEYRKALLQVQYPKMRTEITWGRYEPETRTDRQIAAGRVLNLIRARKRKATEIQNKMKQAKESWCELFPIEQDAAWLKAQSKLFSVKADQARLQEIYNRLKSD